MTARVRIALVLFVLFLAGLQTASAGVIIEFPMSNLYNFNPIVHDPSVSGVLYNSNVSGYDDFGDYGIVFTAYPRAGATTYATALSLHSYFDIVLTFSKGSDLDTMAFEVGKGGASDPRGYIIRSSVDNFATDVAAEQLPTGAAQAPSLRTVNLSSAQFQGLSTVTFRFFVYTPNPAGYYSVDWRNFSFSNDTASAVPEPATWLMLVPAIAGLALLRRRSIGLKPRE